MSDTTSTDAWREVLALFERWLTAEPGDRGALLAEVQRQQPPLHPRLLAMIEADRAAQSLDFLGDAVLPAVPATHGSPTRPTERFAGMRLGAWELIEPIGTGGMGQVWRATRSDGLYSGRAAVKLLHGTRSDPQSDARFAREGELLARLTHPHIAQLLDAGLTPDGTRYLVLEYVQGERLDQWCDARRLTLEARLRLFLQVCEAVSYAHAHLVVHRDLKPPNIFVSDEGHVKLLDFGVAKLLGDTPDASELTRAGSAGLTPEYASPEQVNGAPITTVTDVYALGVLLFVLLSGQRPYGGSASTPAQLARDIAETEPHALNATEPTSDAAAARSTSAARLRQALRGDLAQIVARTLRKAPEERYASVQALADDIGRHLRHEPVSAQAPGWRYRSAKFVRRNRVAVTAASVVSMAVLGGVGATLWQARLVAAESAKANAIKDYLIGVFNTNRIGSDTQTRQNTSARQLLEEGGARLLADRTLPAEARGELLSTLAQLHDNLGLAASGAALSAASAEIACAPEQEHSAGCLAALVAQAHALARIGRVDESNKLALTVIERAERSPRANSAARGSAYYVLGHNAHLAGDMAAALRRLGEAVVVFEREAPQHQQHLESLLWLGNTHIVREDFDAAVAHFKRGLALAESQASLRDYGVGALHDGLADAHASAGRVAEALPHLTLAIERSAGSLGTHHPHVWMMRLVQGRHRHQMGNTAEGRATVDAALAVARDDHMPAAGNLRDRSHVAAVMMSLDEGEIAPALALNGPLVARYAKSGASTLGATLLRQAELESLSGHHAAARDAAQRALALFDRQIGATTIRAKQARVVLAEVLSRGAAEGQEKAQAQRLFEEVLGPAQADTSATPPPALIVQRARARVGLARLALPHDAALALRLAHEAASAIVSTSPLLRERVVLAQARLVEGQALLAQGRLPAARSAIAASLATLTRAQVATSPRLAEAREALAALPG